MVDLAILRLFPESILITMFPTGIPLVNIKQQYKSLARLQQFFLKLVRANIRTIENYPFDISDFTDEEEVFVNPNLSPMDEVFILYINFDPNLFEFLYKYFSIKFTKMQYLKFVEQYEEGEANNIDMSDIQQIKNLFYITISQQIILVLREEIEFFVIPAVNLESSENRVEQTNSIVQLYNKDVCNLEFMHQLKNVCSQFLVDRKNVLVKLDNINEVEDITKAHIYLEEIAKKAQDEKSSSVSRFSAKGGSKQRRNYAILNTLNILTKIQSNSTWGYRARESSKTKINSIAMLLVNLPINTLNPNYEFGMEEEEPYQSQTQQTQPQVQQIPAQPTSTATDSSYNNRNNNTNESLLNATPNNSNGADKTNSSIDKPHRESLAPGDGVKHELSKEIIPEEETEEGESDDLDDDDDEGYEIPPRPTPPQAYNNRSFVVLNDMADNSFDGRDQSRVLHHSKSSNNIDTGAYDGENSELFESHTDICESSSNVYKSCNTIGYSRNSFPIQDSQQFIYHSCLDMDGSRVETDSFESMENIETKLDIDNIDNIENKLEEIHMKCSDENSVILHSSIREIVRNPSKDEENLKIISYIQDEVSDMPHNDSVIFNNTTITATNTTVTTDIINSSPLASSDNEIIPMVVPSNDKPVRTSSTVVTFDEHENPNVEPEVNHYKAPSGNIIYNGTETEHTSEVNATDSSYTTTDDMTNEIVMPELSNMVTQVEPEPEYNQEAMNNTLSILQPCRNFWWESIALHLDLPKDKYQITENLKLDFSDIQFSNIDLEAIKEQDYNIDDIDATLNFIDLKLWLRRQWTVEFCAV